MRVGVRWGVDLECGAVEGREACCGGEDAQRSREFREHGGADVGGDGVAVGVAAEELFEEAAVTVAEHERVTGVVELVEEVRAGALQERAEGEVFGPAVDPGDAVEVGVSAASGLIVA